MVFGWFKATEAVEFGNKLGGMLVERVSTGLQSDEKLLDKKTHETLSSLVFEVDRFKRNNKLNLFQKAKMANALRWKLTDAGFKSEYVEDVVRWLILRLN